MTSFTNRAVAAAASILLCSGIDAQAGERKVVEFKSSYDGSVQKAELFVPSAHDGKTKLPLLVYSHPMGMSMTAARGIGHHASAERLGWMVICPELHGLNTVGKTSFGAVPAQHDVIDAIRYVQANYKVDDTRIYSDGRSMGGTLSLLLAAKYPHIFAAAVSGTPPTDLTIDNGRPFPEILVKEFGGPIEKVPFEYERREPVTYARNLKYTPVILWHGTMDTLVPPEHSSRMFRLMKKYNPYQYPVFWLEGAGHNPVNYGSEWICEKLRWHRKERERFYPDLDFVIDESGRFMWLSLEQAVQGKFSSVKTHLKNSELTLKPKNVRRLTVDLTTFKYHMPTTVYLKCSTEIQLEISGFRGEPIKTVLKRGRISIR